MLNIWNNFIMIFRLIMRRSRGKKQRRRGGGRKVRRRKTRRGGRFQGSRRVKGGRFRGARRVKGAGRQRFVAAIRKLRKLQPTLQVQAMRSANDKFIRCMCSAVRKLKTKRLPAKLTAGLQRNAKKIRKLIKPSTSVRVKRKMLSHKGGFLPLLLAGLAGLAGGPLLSGLLGDR